MKTFSLLQHRQNKSRLMLKKEQQLENQRLSIQRLRKSHMTAQSQYQMDKSLVDLTKWSKGISIDLSPSEQDKLLIKDVRKMYEELNSHLNKGKALRNDIKNKNEQQIKLEQEFKLAEGKINYQEQQIYEYSQNKEQLEKLKLQLEQQLQQSIETYENKLQGLQSEIAQLQRQNESNYVQIQDQQSQIDQFIQKVNADAQLINQYNEYVNQFQQECAQTYGHQYQQGLLAYFKNEFEQQLLSASQSIASLEQDKADLEEQMAKNKTESDKKYKKLNQEKQDLEQELQNAKEQVEKEKKNQNRLMQEINGLKQKLKSSEEELSRQLESLGQSEEQKNQQLKDQNRQLQKQIEAITQENYQLKQTEKEYHNLQNEYKSKVEQYKQAQQQFENTQTHLNDQINKLTVELRNSDRQKQKLESQQEVTSKQSVQQQQMIQQQYEELKQQNNVLKEENIKLTDSVTSLTRQLKDSQAALDEYQIYKQGGEKRTQELIQQNLSLKSQITDFQTEKLKLEQQIASLNGQLQVSRKDQENLKKFSDETIHNLSQEIQQHVKQNDILSEKILWLISKIPKIQHRPKILSLIETIRNQLPVLEDFVKNESGSFDDTDFTVYRINPVENLINEVFQGKPLQDQKILEIQLLGDIKAKRSINATTENSDYFRGFVLKVTHGLGELQNKLYVIRENKNGLSNFPTAEAAVVSAHNQFIAEFILKQFNIFLQQKGRQQSDLRFPVTYILQKKGDPKFYLTEEIQEGPFEKHLGGELPVRNDNDDAKFSNALALYSYYKSGKNMMLSNLQTLNRVYHDTIVCTREGQLTNYDQGLEEIHLITNQLGGKGQDFLEPYLVTEEEV